MLKTLLWFPDITQILKISQKCKNHSITIPKFTTQLWWASFLVKLHNNWNTVLWNKTQNCICCVVSTATYNEDHHFCAKHQYRNFNCTASNMQVPSSFFRHSVTWKANYPLGVPAGFMCRWGSGRSTPSPVPMQTSMLSCSPTTNSINARDTCTC